MTKTEFLEEIEIVHKNMLAITNSKGIEYARSDDQLANFKRWAFDAGVKTEQVWSIMFNKHLDAIKHYCATGQVLSESLTGRIDDAILYLILLRALYHERNKPKAGQFNEVMGVASVLGRDPFPFKLRQ